MPRAAIKPLVKLTKEQLKELLKRVFEKEARPLTAKTGGGLMSEVEPPVEQEMGTLFKDLPELGGYRREQLPIGEARARYFAAPEEYMTPTLEGPSAKVLSQRPTQGMSPEELAEAISYERWKFKPIIPPSTQRSMGAIMRGETIAGEEALLGRAGISFEDIRPGVKVRQVLAEKGLPTKVSKPPVEEVIKVAGAADALWKAMGGARSAEGKRWNQLLKNTTGVIKQHFTTGRDYFISSFYRWKKDPMKFSKSHPREARMFESMRKDPDLEDIWRAFEIGVE